MPIDYYLELFLAQRGFVCACGILFKVCVCVCVRVVNTPGEQVAGEVQGDRFHQRIIVCLNANICSVRAL